VLDLKLNKKKVKIKKKFSGEHKKASCPATRLRFRAPMAACGKKLINDPKGTMLQLPLVRLEFSGCFDGPRDILGSLMGFRAQMWSRNLSRA